MCSLAGSLISADSRKSWAPWPVSKAFYGHTATGNGSGSLSLSLALEPGGKSRFSIPKGLEGGQGSGGPVPQEASRHDQVTLVHP